MYCRKCGTEQENNASFCHSCGEAINKSSSSNNFQFYSEDWRRKKVFTIASLPYYDIALDENFLYLISLPRYKGGTLGLILGLILFNILGAIIGTMIGNSSDKNKRKNYRSNWLGSEQKIISNTYEKDVFIKIPRDSIKRFVSFENKKIVVSFGNKKAVLVKNKNEIERLNNYLNENVL